METPKMKNKRLQRNLFDKLSGASWVGNDYFSAFCVFDIHKRPALLVYEDGFYCLSCIKGGSLKTLQYLLSTTFIHRTKNKTSALLPRWKKWETLYGEISEIADFAHENLKKTKVPYFHNRGLDQFIDKGMFGFLDGWALIPVFSREKEVIDIVVRSISQKGIKYVIRPYSKQEMRPLYSPDWDRVLKSHQVFVTYGIFDAWAFEAIEKPCVTGITGKSINPTLFEEFTGTNFIIVPDDGEEREAYRLANALGWRGSVLRLDYPPEIKDPDEMRRNITENQWKQLFEGELNAANMVSAVTD